MGMKKLAKGMLIGALVGGAITLFDSETREEVVKTGKKIGTKVWDAVTNPQATWSEIQEKVDGLQRAYQEVNDDIRFIVEKAREIKELGEETGQLIRETKNTFIDEREDTAGTDVVI